MSEITQRIRKLLREDRRFKPDAYQFVQEALGYAQNTLDMGVSQPNDFDAMPRGEVGQPAVERHLTGQQLCEAIRQFAQEQYGYLAKIVLHRWGIRKTDDFGDIVYNLISVGCMKKSKHDRREDFNDVYDFDEAFCDNFRITHSKER